MNPCHPADLPFPLSTRRAWLRRLPALLMLGAPGAFAGVRPPLMLANTYRQGVPLVDYWVSEKYDGVRTYWDGSRLFTRGGEPINAPGWFTRGWPAQAMDGELWAGRGRFEETVSTVRRQEPQEQAWRMIAFMAFDLPHDPGTFDQRLPRLRALVDAIRQPWVVAVRQRKVASADELRRLQKEIEHQGGEGLVLHRGASLYRAERSDDLLKLKSEDDAEARVIDYLPGRGKYAGMTGALVVQTPQGVRFNIGSGLSDAQRREPPPLGSIITYRYRGLHGSGKPRFAVLVQEHGG